MKLEMAKRPTEDKNLSSTSITSYTFTCKRCFLSGECVPLAPTQFNKFNDGLLRSKLSRTSCHGLVIKKYIFRSVTLKSRE